MNRQSPRPPVAKKRNGLRGSRGALAPKKPFLSKRPKPKPRIQLTLNSDTDCRFQIRKHSIGGPGVLWHLKNSDLSNAVSQSPRIPLWHLKSHTLPKAPNSAELNSGKKTPVSLAEKHSKARTGKLSQKAQLFAVLCLCREKRSVFGKTRVAKVLWHLKSHYLPKAPSQSPEFSLR